MKKKEWLQQLECQLYLWLVPSPHLTHTGTWCCYVPVLAVVVEGCSQDALCEQLQRVIKDASRSPFAKGFGNTIAGLLQYRIRYHFLG